MLPLRGTAPQGGWRGDCLASSSWQVRHAQRRMWGPESLLPSCQRLGRLSVADTAAPCRRENNIHGDAPTARAKQTTHTTHRHKPTLSPSPRVGVRVGSHTRQHKTDATHAPQQWHDRTRPQQAETPSPPRGGRMWPWLGRLTCLTTCTETKESSALCVRQAASPNRRPTCHSPAHTNPEEEPNRPWQRRLQCRAATEKASHHTHKEGHPSVSHQTDTVLVHNV